MCERVASLKQHVCGMLQAGEMVADEVQNQLMLLAIQDIAKLIANQAAATPAAAPAAAGVKPAAKPAGGKARKDEPKPVQVLLTCVVCAVHLKL